MKEASGIDSDETEDDTMTDIAADMQIVVMVVVQMVVVLVVVLLLLRFVSIGDDVSHLAIKIITMMANESGDDDAGAI